MIIIDVLVIIEIDFMKFRRIGRKIIVENRKIEF